MNVFWPCRSAVLGLLALGASSLGAAPAPASSRDWAETLPSRVRAQVPEIARAVERSQLRLHAGDDARWARPDWDDHDWEHLDITHDIPAHRGIFWVRFHVQSPNPADRVPTGAWISGTAAYELYWDGALLVRNGTPGNRREDEVPGRLDVLPRIPETLTGPGEHVVAMRMSSYRVGFPGDKSPFVFFMNDPAVVQAWHMRNGIFPTLAAGGMFILTFACGLIWSFAVRRPALLCLGALGLCAAASQMLTALRWFYTYPADWHYPVAVSQAYLNGMLAWCVVGFVVTHFAVPRGRWILVSLVPLLTSVYWINSAPFASPSAWLIITAYGVAAGPLIWAVRRRSPGAWPVIIGIGASAAWILADPWPYTWTGFFPRFLPTLLGLIAATTMQIRVERREARQARLTAARLEIELLKKSLQPHFFMNTLTALAQTMEENPTSAVKLIDDLAEEFRTLAAISGEKQVPLMREIALCRAHLRVMRARTDVDWTLETNAVDLNAPVPPALFLTLIENGFSHQCARKGATTFKLHVEMERDVVRYAFLSPGLVTAETKRAAGGTGLRYVRARLEESFPGAWSLSQDAVPEGWETIIELRRPGRNGERA